MLRNTKRVLLSTVAVVALMAPTLKAAPVTVNNFSFEADAPGVFIPVTDWHANSAQTGVLASGIATDGTQIARLGSGGEADYIYQDVGLLADNTTYTLTVSAGWDGGGFSGGPGSIQLLNGTDQTGVVEAATILPNFNTVGLTDFTTSFTTGLGSSGDLVINITQDGNGGRYLSLDNVRLDATVVPEPASLSLLGLGAIGLMSRRRRRA